MQALALSGKGEKGGYVWKQVEMISQGPERAEQGQNSEDMSA